MSRTIALIIVISLALPIAFAFGNLAIPARPLTILPEDCQLAVDEELLLTLDRKLPSNAVAVWDVNAGGVSSVLPGESAVLVAPPYPTVLTISVTIHHALPGMKTPITRQCTVTPLSSGSTD